MSNVYVSFFFFFNDTATTEIYTLSLHDALPIFCTHDVVEPVRRRLARFGPAMTDRKSTRLNSSHMSISYAVFCLKKKNCAVYIAFIFLFAISYFFVFIFNFY